MPETASLFTGLNGKVTKDYPLGSRSWFAAGGNAEYLYSPSDAQELAEFLKRAITSNTPVYPVGRLSNCLIRDGGLKGICIQLGKAFTEVEFTPTGVIAGAAVLDRNISALAEQEGRSGLEFLSGIPGSIGGAAAMNAGCYGAEMKDILDWLEVALPTGKVEQLNRDQIEMTYRHTALPENAVITRVAMNTTTGFANGERERIKQLRESSQPVKAKTGGSTFRNPEGHRAWELIDKVGFRGKKIGDAQFNEKHCNFLVNLGNATAHDIEQLGEEARAAVLKEFNIDLHWEIKRLGSFQ